MIRGCSPHAGGDSQKARTVEGSRFARVGERGSPSNREEQFEGRKNYL